MGDPESTPILIRDDREPSYGSCDPGSTFGEVTQGSSSADAGSTIHTFLWIVRGSPADVNSGKKSKLTNGNGRNRILPSARSL